MPVSLKTGFTVLHTVAEEHPRLKLDLLGTWIKPLEELFNELHGHLKHLHYHLIMIIGLPSILNPVIRCLLILRPPSIKDHIFSG